MTPWESIKTCYKRTFIINTRSCRSEYWWFMLYFWGSLILCVTFSENVTALAVVFGIMCFSALIPLFTARIRRLHDTGHSAWNILWGCIPYLGFIGDIYVIILTCQEGDCYENEYGKNPLEVKDGLDVTKIEEIDDESNEEVNKNIVEQEIEEKDKHGYEDVNQEIIVPKSEWEEI